ncbi:MAG: DUF881 domain-containing protein [Nocardioides sp.]
MPEQDPTPAPAEDGRTRLVRALRTPPNRGQVVAAVLLAVLGFAAVTQVKSQNQNTAYVGASQDELVALINSLSLASQRTENEIADLVATRNSLLNDTEARRTALEQARQQAEQYGILAGTLPAIGPGVRIEVADPTGAVGSDSLINGIQELRDAGAEAIELNDTVRVVAQTALRDGPNGGVIADGERIAAPYVIEAIGSAHDLATALDIAQGFTDEIERRGGKVTISEADSVEITTVREPAPTRYAEPVPTE